MTRQVLLVLSLVGLIVAVAERPARSDDPAQTSSRRTRSWKSTDAPRQTAQETGSGLSTRLRAMRSGEATKQVLPPSTRTGKTYRSVLRSDSSNTVPSEPKSFRVSEEDAGQAIPRTARRIDQQLANVGAPGVRMAATSRETSVLPQLEVEMIAPESVVLGRPAKWQVVVRNAGRTSSPVIDVTATLPGNATVAATDSSAGVVTQQAAAKRRLVWRLDGLGAGATATMTVSLVAQSSAPMALQVDWAVIPSTLAATVEVREPKLEVAISGPNEMRFGASAEFAVTLYNPGTGPAENVTITVGSGASRTQPQLVGTLPAGGQRTIELELAADQAGELEVVAHASADGGLKAEAAHRVRVRRPKLELALDGPKLQFAGVPATYTLHVSNRGDIDAEQAVVEVALPSGAKVLAASAEAREVDGRVVWQLARVAPSSEQVLQVKCLLTREGTNQIQAAIQDDSGQTVQASVDTRVELVADLKLTVNDPAGPQLVGEEVEYRIVIENRGSKAARNVKVIAQFSDGVEPISAAGQQARMVPGQVLFSPIDSIAPGRKIELTVKAKASAAGSRLFRAEVHCKDIDTNLAAQETTKFFQ